MQWHRYKPYWELMRFHKPVGILLLLWPTLWGLWVAAGGVPPLRILVVFVLGTVVMRAAGCVINDIADRKIDLHVARTRGRPLTSGQITLHQALMLFGALLSVAFFLVLFLNPLTIALAFMGAMLTIVYPFMKRFIQAPQFVLGLAFAWGIPMGFAALHQSLSQACWLLFGVAVIWPLMYDTLYAMTDRKDDLNLGVKSTAIWFGSFDRVMIGLLQMVICVLLVVFGVTQEYGLFYFISLFLVGLLFLYQQYLIRYRDPVGCFRAFLNNQWVGLVLWVGFCFYHLLTAA